MEWIELVKKRLCLPAYEIQDEHDDLWWTMPKELLDDVLEDIAKDIAQAHEQDKLIGVLEERAGNLAELGQLRGRLAVMADCLKWLDDHHVASHGAWHDDAEEYSEQRNNQVLDTIPKILQSAPKVLMQCSVVGRTDEYADVEKTIFELEDGGYIYVDDWVLTDEQDGQEFELFVLAEGTNALQEQSKAELPDSEQEEPCGTQ